LSVNITHTPDDLDGPYRELLPGVTAIKAYGHTPGHCAYLLRSGSAKLIIWGDTMHVQKIQFAIPSQSVTFDSDPAEAAAWRARVLAWAAKNHAVVAGMHLLYPAIGFVSARSDVSGYTWTPAG
jgi:glyoxylase-like metal-dependent hydrolase (beta-lactamase superfamily II)